MYQYQITRRKGKSKTIVRKIISNNFNFEEKLGLFTIALAVLWRPLSVWYLHIDSAARLQLFLFVLSFIFLFKEFWKYAMKKPVLIYIFVAIYMVINGVVSQSGLVYGKDGNYLIFTHVLEPVLTMMITIVLARKNLSMTLRWLAWISLAFCILCLRNSGYDANDRLNAEINANEIAIHAAVCFGLFLLRFLRNRATRSWLPIILSLIPLYIILKTGSRMALGMIAIMAMFAWLSKLEKIKVKNIVIIVLVGAALYSAANYILDSTMIGERMMSTTDSDELYGATETILDSYGDRGLQYYYSWPYFLENPIFGIGFHQWKLYSPSNLVSHSEYMVQYVECGLVAFIPYMVFLISLLWLAISSLKQHFGKQGMATPAILLSFMLAVIFSNSVLWSYNIHIIFIVYGVVIAYSSYVSNKEKGKNLVSSK